VLEGFPFETDDFVGKYGLYGWVQLILEALSAILTWIPAIDRPFCHD